MNRYPTDEELELLIQSLEQEELYAPRHLKEEILQKTLQTQRSKPSVSFLTYTLKMVAGMAAAVLLTFAIPISDGSDLSRAQVRMEQMQEDKEAWEERLNRDLQKKESLDEKITRHVAQKREDIYAATDSMLEKVTDFWNRENGGN